jgi:archaellin
MGFEILLRLSAGSNDIDLTKLAFTVLTADEIFTAVFNDSIMDDNCTWANLNPQQEFCIDHKFGNSTSSMIGDDDLVSMRFLLNESNYLNPNSDFGVSFIPQEGAYVNIELTTPKILNRRLTHIRI